MTRLCRDCGHLEADFEGRCPRCRSPRSIAHPELATLAIAHIDCDAFYAAIEKRDDPTLAEKPVIVGGGRRGVVSACCYIARLYGVRSAMPMFQALKACPQAVVIKPDMAKYRTVGMAVRNLMLAVTPLVEPLSIDEAFLDLSGTEALHGGPPARTLALLARRIEAELAITVSIGLAPNKFLAKIASDLDKPRGFAAIGRAEAPAFLAPRPVTFIWGVGQAAAAALARDGLRTIGDLQRRPAADLIRRHGGLGERLSRLAFGHDTRRVEPNAPAKSVSAETTFDVDLADAGSLRRALWPLCETVSRRLKAGHIAGRSITLKLKTADFRILTRSRQLGDPTQLAETIYRAGLPLLEKEANGTRFRLIGIGAADLGPDDQADPPDLVDPTRARAARVERVIDTVRDRLGRDAIGKGRAMATTTPDPAAPPRPGRTR
ncbi:DNA polymerase IV [Allostella sp. ATCC 35155]|nr:DNA polymerase IV [Stella sp. ATCC 35155]